MASGEPVATPRMGDALCQSCHRADEVVRHIDLPKRCCVRCGKKTHWRFVKVRA